MAAVRSKSLFLNAVGTGLTSLLLITVPAGETWIVKEISLAPGGIGVDSYALVATQPGGNQVTMFEVVNGRSGDAPTVQLRNTVLFAGCTVTLFKTLPTTFAAIAVSGVRLVGLA